MGTYCGPRQPPCISGRQVEGLGLTDLVWQSIVIHALSFLIFVFLLGKILFKPVTRVMEKRNDKIAALQDSTDSAQREAESLKNTLQRQLDDARREAGRIMESLRAEAEAKRDQQISEMRVKVQRLRDENAKRLKEETDDALAALEPYVKELGRMIAEKAIGRRLAG